MSNRVVFGTLLVLMAISGCVYYDWGGDSGRVRFERVEELQRPLAPGAEVMVSTASGSIDVKGTETDQCQVIATIVARASSEQEAQDLAAQVDVRMEPLGQGWKIYAEQPSHLQRRSISVSYQITVPYETHIDCSSASGALHVTRIKGQVQAHAASGSVEAVDLHSASGAVRCERVYPVATPVYTASAAACISWRHWRSVSVT